MTLERDPAAVLVHERLQQAVSSMRAPDIEAGWAALAEQLEPPLAPVVPLRKPSRGRIVVLAAAALLVAGTAFAAVSHFGSRPADRHVPSIAPIQRPMTGPHIHEPFAGPPPDPRPSDRRHDGSQHPAGPSAGPSDGGTTTAGGSHQGASKPGDDPNDRDQGTGNDGQHNDHGGGNNGAEGTKKPHESGGSSSHGRSHH